MEKKQQQTDTSKESAKHVKRNTNTDENIEKVYENYTPQNNEEEIDEDDAAHEELRRKAAKDKSDF